MKINLIAAALCGLTFSAVSMAEDAPKKDEHEYKASAELGFLFKTGNTKSGDIKTGFDLDHTYGLWRNAFRFDLLYKKTEQEIKNEDGTTSDEFITDDQKWNVVTQTNYTIGKEGKNYIYGNFGYEDDRFSGFDNQSSVSVGWGKAWYETEQASFFADIGPGYKRDVISEVKDSDGNVTTKESTEDIFIVQAQALYKRQINTHVDFKQTFVAKVAPDSDDNSTYKAETSITTKLIETLQLKFSFTVDHNTQVEEGADKTDTQTAVTLVYSF